MFNISWFLHNHCGLYKLTNSIEAKLLKTRQYQIDGFGKNFSTMITIGVMEEIKQIIFTFEESRTKLFTNLMQKAMNLDNKCKDLWHIINLYLYFSQKSIEIVAYSAFVDPWDRNIVLLRLWGKEGALLREESDKVTFFFFCSSLQEEENEGRRRNNDFDLNFCFTIEIRNGDSESCFGVLLCEKGNSGKKIILFIFCF